MSFKCATNCANRPRFLKAKNFLFLTVIFELFRPFLSYFSFEKTWRKTLLLPPALSEALFCLKKATPRFELGDKSFAGFCLTTWPCRLTSFLYDKKEILACQVRLFNSLNFCLVDVNIVGISRWE